jgi:hypothetical protein
LISQSEEFVKLQEYIKQKDKEIKLKNEEIAELQERNKLSKSKDSKKIFTLFQSHAS